MNANLMEDAKNIIDSINGKKNVKIVKKDNGLMERKECEEKIILTEDNRQVIFG